jgi:hypothetical protein
VWLSDGNIVFQARERAFCIYRGLLVRKSVVFAALFSLPQSEAEQLDTVDGFPLVRLDDEPDDFEVFLLALLDAE